MGLSPPTTLGRGAPVQQAQAPQPAAAVAVAPTVSQDRERVLYPQRVILTSKSSLRDYFT